MIKFNPVLTEKQTLAWDNLENPSKDEILYGGAKYGGKSWFLCVWSYLFACEFAKKHKIPKSDHPLPIGFMGRKIAKTFHDTTLETWFKTIPAGGYVAKGKPVELIIDNRVKILTGGLDHRETINKFNSAEFAFFALDQAEEVTEDDIALLRLATFGRLVVNDKVIPGKGIFTANPRKCWLRDEFIINPTSKRAFVSALPTDNPYCTQKYIDNLKDSLKHRPELLEAYLHGNWSVLEGPDIIITEAWVRQAAQRTFSHTAQRELLTCDVARFGDDETAIYHLKETEIVDENIYGKKDTMHTANILHVMSHKAGGLPIIVDEDGVGGGVVDRLKEMGDTVHGVCSQRQSSKPELYYNLRAEIWDKAARMFCDGDVQLHNCDEKLRTQLSMPAYNFKNGKQLVSSKDDMKAQYGCSPDRADAYVMGITHLKYGKSARKKTRRDRWDAKPEKVSAMAG